MPHVKAVNNDAIANSKTKKINVNNRSNMFPLINFRP